ncbi:FAD binding domain-containing protein [Methylocella sp.]|uniref:FAD binding domain-containing protein n=1 Tax=Methylocella sp. TaxID=1978226 RepID=UPI0035B0F542
MKRFAYLRASSVAEAAAAVAADPRAAFVAGGANLVDLMKYDVARPTLLVHVARLPLREAFARVADAILAPARPLKGNAFKVELPAARFCALCRRPRAARRSGRASKA